MQHAWEYVIVAAQNLHRQGLEHLTRAQLMQEVQRLGWQSEMVTIGTHISDHMRADRETAAHSYLDRVARNAYPPNDAGRRAAQGL
ncbi:hypothetical protein IHN63_01000 [Deinococcus sp. 6YEL10]|uniref:hypothetical protein n=1 Tax=Deinococcus sp. 6YEL10 TaxID=2745870 RepID=UPI001E29EDE1|nr:hypothetical protein [Deinococcus sp. 6YEL10]MCD0159874.1 hypothetical protein [Deinococcus sp. 6YEL10]